MNRLLTRNPAAVTPQQLPPVARSGGVRMLLINSNNLGFSTQAAQLRVATQRRDDVDAVHVDVVHPTWARVLGKTVRPMRGWDLSAWRYLLMYRHIVRRWLRGPLPLDRFDVVQITTQGIGMAIADLKASGVRGTKFAVYVDSTAALEVREFGFPALAAAPMRAAERRIFDAADLVVCMSRWVAASLAGDYGVRPERLFAAPGCVNIPAARPSPPGEGQLPRILFVGNDWRRKGGPRLLAMHQKHFADRAELHVVSAAAPHRASAATERNVVWHGRVPRDRLLGDLLPAMDLLALPTATDMSPWAVLE
ncbi:MAG: glycosyltransferase, partial [Tepidisphaeraceae bacterium]